MLLLLAQRTLDELYPIAEIAQRTSGEPLGGVLSGLVVQT